MIKKVRIKLIAVTMFALLMVLGLILGAINVLNYHNIVQEADQTLEILMDNQGEFPQEGPPGKPPHWGVRNETDAPEQTVPEKPTASQSDASSAGDSEDAETGDETEKDREMEKEPRRLSPETPYSARYFWVLLDNEGSVLETNTDRIISVDGTTAEDYAKRVLASGKSSGFYEDFRYAVSEEEEGIRVIFLDCYTGRLTFRRFLTASLGISALGMLAVFLLVALLSGRIIRPISESYEKQRQFITDAGHEIKTPLAIIDADAEVLEMDVGEDNEWVADIRQQIKRLTGLTNDLIFLSRMEEGSGNLLKTEFSYSEALEEIIQPFRSLAKIREKDLEIRIEEGVDFYGDEKSILQLASILMDNAMKYAPEHSTVSVRAGRNSRGVYLEVENAAPELRKTDIDHMFDRFYRADASRNSSQGGHGIGLSMARAIAEAHGGKIHGEKVGEDRLKISAVLPNKKPNNG